jgi:Domain of unknown function (DUF4062)/PhoH-like protein
MSSFARVMISSTTRDLMEHRQALKDACLSVNMFPDMMEHLPASGEDAVEISLRKVDNANVYVGIFAHRYGYVPDDHEVSITELEYWRAVERGIPILIFLIHESIPANSDEPDYLQRQLALLKENLKHRHIVKFFKSPADLTTGLIASLWHLRDGAEPTSARIEDDVTPVSQLLRTRLTELNQTIESLTQEQTAVIRSLRFHKRVAVAGCAGSGKTLVAVEKALRMDESGTRTLLVCHNRYLADYIRLMVRGSGVMVTDFTSWILRLTGAKADVQGSWTHYDEPTDDELALAFDTLASSTERYGAIIVDEGQDFREEWWLLIEAALVDPEQSVLYVFHDDNQALLPYRSNYPLFELPFVLSKNCRNAGAIYEIVRRFHPQSPDPSLHLRDQGVSRRWLYDAGQEDATLEAAVNELLTLVPLERMVLLTTEPDPLENATLFNASILMPPKHRWQDFITNYLSMYNAHTPELSDARHPTPDDIAAVMRFAKSVYPATWGEPSEHRRKQGWKWEINKSGYGLTGKYRLGKLFDERWADDLPAADADRITVANGELAMPGTLRYYTVSSFKGLEADGVILLMPTYRPDLDAIAYVGASRAKLVLFAMIERHVMRHVPHLLAASE